MDFHGLRDYAAHHDKVEVRVIRHSGSRFYQVELEDLEGRRRLLLQRGKPKLFRVLDDVYLELKRAGIDRAYLVQYAPTSEIISHETHYHEPLTPRMPLAF